MPSTTSTPKVGTTTAVAPSTLSTFHRNARRGDVDAIAASLKAHGQYKPITVNIGTHTGRPNEVLAGNHTLIAFRNLADDPAFDKVLVHWVDVDDDMCSRIVLADNRTSELGGFDTAELAALLQDVGADLTGLGYTALDLDDLNALLEEAAPLLPTDDLGGDPFAFADRAPQQASPRVGEDGLIASTDVTTLKESYADSATRMVILALPVAQFVWIQPHLEAMRKERGHASNADLIVSLVEEITGDKAPAPDSTLGA